MRYYFPESSIENPLTFFEFAYSNQGQTHLRREYLSEAFDLEEFGDPDFDLEKESLHNWYQDQETGETYEYYYSFKEYLNDKFKIERKNTFKLISLRIDACDSPSAESYVLQKFQLLLDRCTAWVQKSTIPFKQDHLLFIGRFRVALEQVCKFRTGLSSLSLQESEEEKLKKIISGLNFIQSADNDTFLHFLLCDDISSVTSKIQVLCDNRQFHYILDKFISIGYPVSFGMKEIIKSEIFLRESDSKPFTASNFYNVSSLNKSTTPKKAKEIDEVFSQF